MNTDMYKIGSTIPIKRELIVSFFEKLIVEKQSMNLYEFELKDGSKLLLKNSIDKDKFFVNIYLKFNIIKDEGQKSDTLRFSLYPILKFFTKCDSGMKNLRTNVEMAVSEGALLSDIYSSSQFRKALRIASNPKDSQIQGRKNKLI